MKTGTHRDTGAALGGVAYLRQRLSDVINTQLGSLVGRREFGSRMYELLDRNINEAFHMNAYVLLAEAINNPANGLDDFKLKEMQIERLGDAHYSLTIMGYLDDGNPVTMEGLQYG